MAKSLNPRAVASPHPTTPPTQVVDEPRRNLLAAVAATLIGAFVGLVPIAAGLATFLDPLLKRKAKGGTEEKGPPFRRIASLDALPPDGTPVQVPVIADLTDAWNR